MSKLAVLLAGAMLMLTVSNKADALSITFSETGYSDIVITDAADGLTDGKIQLSGYTFHDFVIDFIGGRSSLPNNPAKNTLAINSVSVANQSTSIKNLIIKVSDTGYILNPVYPVALNALATFGSSGSDTGSGTTGQFNAFLDINNTLFGTTTALGQWGPTDLIGASSTIKTLTGLTDAPFSLTEVISLTQGEGGSATFNANVGVAPVPEPGTMVLLGFGMLGLAIYGKRRMNKES